MDDRLSDYLDKIGLMRYDKDEDTVVSIPSRIIGEYIVLKYMEEPGHLEKLLAGGHASKETRRFMEKLSADFPEGNSHGKIDLQKLKHWNSK